MNTNPPGFQPFSELATDFCAWCEAESLGPRREAQAAKWLARLHAAAIELPEIDADNEDGRPEISTNHLRAAERNLSAFNGWYYRKVFDPEPTNDEEPVTADVGDDLLDTYKDIKAGLLLVEGGRTEEALWYWSFMHRIHWGRHAIGALAALHAHECQRRE